MFHARENWVPGGILGVDLFFVLSSFLITSILLNEWERTGSINFWAYFGRRVRRLVPALLFFLSAMVVTLLFVSDHPAVDVKRWVGGVFATLFYVANWFEIRSDTAYFEQFAVGDSEAEAWPLRHVWSFSIEEQFYLVAPFFVAGILRFAGRWARWVIVAVCVVGAIASAWWMAALFDGPGTDPSRAYYGTDTRVQALFVGIALSVLVRWWGPVRTALGSRLAVAGAYVSTVYFAYAIVGISWQDSWMFDRGGFLLAALMSALMVFGIVQPHSGPLHRILEASWMRWVGKISYGLYLYHWPVFLVITRWWGNDDWILIPYFAITFALSTLSWYLLESPVLKRTWPLVGKAMKPKVGGAVAIGTMAAICGVVLFADATHDEAPEIARQLPSTIDATAGQDPTVADNGELRVMVVGDSVSAQLGHALNSWAMANPGEIVVHNESHLGCVTGRYGDKRQVDGTSGPVGDICSAWADPVAPEDVADPEVVSWVTARDVFKPDVVLMMVTAWDATDRRVPSLGDQWWHVGDEIYDDYLRSEYSLAADILTADGATLYWMASPWIGNRPSTISLKPPDERIDKLNAIVAEVAADDPNQQILDFPDFVGEIDSPRELAIRDDGVHLSETGFFEAGTWLAAQLGLDTFE
jgi:peptidoglycan/LPS O-acetylase OafA/YrhL